MKKIETEKAEHVKPGCPYPIYAYYYAYHWDRGAGREQPVSDDENWLEVTFDIITADIQRFPELAEFDQVVLTIRNYIIIDCKPQRIVPSLDIDKVTI